VFARADITGHKRTMCEDCLKKFTAEWKEKGRKTNGYRLQTNLESVNRNQIDGFIRYFKNNHYMFWDIFGRGYSDQVAREEFNKVMNWESRRVIE
jgi:hypothetical protein